MCGIGKVTVLTLERKTAAGACSLPHAEIEFTWNTTSGAHCIMEGTSYASLNNVEMSFEARGKRVAAIFFAAFLFACECTPELRDPPASDPRARWQVCS